MPQSPPGACLGFAACRSTFTLIFITVMAVISVLRQTIVFGFLDFAPMLRLDWS
jgi:hypothetical protein